MSYLIGADLGGTRIRAALFDQNAVLLERVEQPTRASEGASAVMARVAESIEQVLPDEPGDVVGIGLSSPGPLDPVTGRTFTTPNLPFSNLPIRDILEQATGLRVAVGNDADLAALAEYTLGAGKGTRTMVYMTISTGIGSGLIINGQLHTGRGQAGELGFISIAPGDPISGPDRKGYLENIASGPALARVARERIAAGEASLIRDMVSGDVAAITGKTVGEAARQGDRLAREVIAQAGRYIGIGISSVLVMLHPDMVVLGGAVSLLGDLLFEPIREAVREYAVDPIYWRETPIVPAQLGDDVALIGAALLAKLRFIDEPGRGR
ncbi:MAG: ROK family protein [Anaerolineae bacterium]|nr:ROK family protein [Anaerolineae bacterium]